MQTRLDPLALLERTDKWFLGGGKAALYAPAYGWGERADTASVEATPRVFVALNANRMPDSWTVNLAERTA